MSSPYLHAYRYPLAAVLCDVLRATNREKVQRVIFATFRVYMTLFQGSHLHTHVENCEGTKDERQGEPSKYYYMTVDVATPLFLYMRGEWPLPSACDHFFACVCRGESGNEARVYTCVTPLCYSHREPLGSQ